ncbi:Estradiol 17-beta-dehydrogenase 2 like protein [Argiope bruennichi]|uniref:Estradiol 17-beta-dehydrogenase 2 like protein n=1 Tax=Argiope bruennichi TaxID=94029 RepID=A0A8T0E6H7_ARGBR|nr:Estradiol 17-beta-dehydrogenase 2 like protein [Argiope bruennichi]
MCTLDDFKDVYDVNLMGVVRVTKAFLPLLKKSKGRIVNVTSHGGKVALPFFAAYLSSKFAAIGLSDCLRHEVGMEGISVVSIEPEIFYTPFIYESTKDQLNSMGSQGSSIEDDHGEDFKKSLKDLGNVFMSFASRDTSIVIDDLEAAISLGRSSPIILGPKACRKFLPPLKGSFEAHNTDQWSAHAPLVTRVSVRLQRGSATTTARWYMGSLATPGEFFDPTLETKTPNSSWKT